MHDNCGWKEEDRKPESKITDISLWFLEILKNLGIFTVEIINKDHLKDLSGQ